jgi:hypothetical protein
MKTYFLYSGLLVSLCCICAENDESPAQTQTETPEQPVHALSALKMQTQSAANADDSFFDQLFAAAQENESEENSFITALVEEIAEDKAKEAQHSYMNIYVTPYLASLVTWYAYLSKTIKEYIATLYR